MIARASVHGPSPQCPERHGLPDPLLAALTHVRASVEMLKRDLPGYAIGGLSGGESKDEFWKIVKLTASLLPPDKPRYCMGVGYAVDLMVCVALGVDMFDCVFPTRTAVSHTLPPCPRGQLARGSPHPLAPVATIDR